MGEHDGREHGGTTDWSTVPSDEIEALLVSWSAREAAVRAELLAVLAVFVERRGWERWECLSPQQWLSWKCGLGRVAASEHVRVAMALTRLPAVAAALRSGRLTWSKVREITRVATPESEPDWLRLAEAGTAAHVERVVRAFRRVTPAQVEHQHADRRLWTTVDDDGSVVLHVKLPTETGSSIADAIRRSTEPATGVPLSARMADRFVAAVTGGVVVVPEVIFHADASVLDGSEGVCTTATGHAVAPEVALLAACVGVVQWVVHDGVDVVAVSKRRRFASPAQRRFVEARARTCEVDGCDVDGRDFHVHHVRPRARDGATEVGNLRRLCPGHHRLIHVRQLEVEIGATGRLRLFRRDGTAVDHHIARWPVREAAPVGSPVPAWTGEPLDIGLTLDCLIHNPVSRRKRREAAA